MDRLSYLQSAENDYSSDLADTSYPCKNLTEVFQSLPLENIDAENLKVYLRVRPSLLEERQQDKDTHLEILDNHSIILAAPASSNTFRNSNHGISKLRHKFTFSHIYGPSTSQKELFETSTLGLVRDFVHGQNCLLFTYGATNSGKTYTVQGTPTDAGILPRTLDVIFNTIGEHHYPKNDIKPQYFCSVMRLDEKDIQREEEKKENIFRIDSELNSTSHSSMSLSKLSASDDSLNSYLQQTEVSRISNPLSEISRASSLIENQYHDDTSIYLADTENTVYATFVSFAEIYNEYVYDLLEKMPTSKKNKRNPLMLGEDRNGAIYIKGLQEVRVRSAEEASKLLEIGRQNLHFAATRLNHNSSRSHCIFTVKIIKLACSDSPHLARVSMLSICDLAGAERAGKTLNTHDRLKEAGSINTSLLVLSRCIEALRRNQMQKGSKKREIPVPYRDSRLTRLFQSFFLGSGKAAMIVNIAKTPFLFDETLQVLKFAAIAKQVAIAQTETECRFQAPKRISQFSKFVRQSLNTSGRLSVPWMKGASDVTFGASEGIPEEESMNTIEEEDQESEKFEALIQLISSLREKLVKEHKEKVELEERLREELCAEFSQQIVEIEESWSKRLKDQQTRSEELTEWKLHALMKSAKVINNHKRFRAEDDPDEEYVSSLLLFQEQHKVQEQSKHIGELETEVKHLKAEIEALMNSQKKTSEGAAKVQEENSKLTFQLAQLTHNFDKVTVELQEAKHINESCMDTDNMAIKELQNRLDKRKSLLEVRDSEIKELKDMLFEAAEAFIAKEHECENLEKKLEENEKTITKQLMSLNEMENQLDDTHAMLSQNAAQLEERDYHIAELQERLASQKFSWLQQERNDLRKKMQEKEIKCQEIEEEYLRDKSKLLLELAELKSSKVQTIPGHSNELEVFKAAELRAAQLQQEKESVIQERDSLHNELLESKILFSHLQKANSQLEKEYDVLVRERDQLKDDIDELSNKLISVQEERASEQLDTSGIKATSVMAMNQINTMQNELSEKEAYISSLKEQVLHLQLQVSELEKSKNNYLQELERNNEKLRENITTLEGKLSDSEMDNEQYKDLHDELKQLSEKLQEVQREKEDMKKEQDHLKDKMHLADENFRLKITDEGMKIKSLESEISQMRDDLTRRETEMESIREKKEAEIANIEKLVKNKDSLNMKLQTEKEDMHHQLNQEILRMNSEIIELESNNKALKMELEKLHCTLESKTESELQLHKLSNDKDNQIEELNSRLQCQKSLEEDIVLLKLKCEEKKVEQEKLQLGIEAEKEINRDIISKKDELQDQILSKDDELKKLHIEYDDLKNELEESHRVLAKYEEESFEKQTLVKELSDLQELIQEFQNTKAKLEEKLQEKESHIDRLKDAKTHLKAQLTEVEKEKSDLERKLFDKNVTEQVKDEIKELQKCLTAFKTKNAELNDKYLALQQLADKKTVLLNEKDELIASLNNKVYSLDCKLTRADEELAVQSHAAQNLETAQERCNILEKEIRAVREARQEESLLYDCQVQEKEELLKQKEVEISSLQEEVKKLLQQSTIFISNTSQASFSETPKVKKEMTDNEKDIITLKERVRQSEAQNDSLMQEVNGLKNQLEKMSLVSDSSVVHCSNTKASCKKILRDTSASDIDSIVTPARRGRKARAPALTPSDSLHLVLDSSVATESHPNPLTSGDSSNITRKSSRPQRFSRRVTRRTTYNDSFEYEYNPEASSNGEDEDNIWEPSVPIKRTTRSTRRPKGRKSKIQNANPHLNNQENKSILANNADESQPSQETDGGNTRVQRQKRQLYKSVVDEPYQCSPSRVQRNEVADSPHNIVRRQLRNKKK